MIRKVQQRAEQQVTGFKSPADDYLEGRLDISDKLVVDAHCTFYFQMNGNEMVGFGIQDRALLIVDRSLKVVHDSIIVAVFNGEFVCRKYREDHVGVYLVSDNNSQMLAQGQTLEVWGVVTAACIPTLPKGLQNGRYRHVCLV